MRERCGRAAQDTFSILGLAYCRVQVNLSGVL